MDMCDGHCNCSHGEGEGELKFIERFGWVTSNPDNLNPFTPLSIGSLYVEPKNWPPGNKEKDRNERDPF